MKLPRDLAHIHPLLDLQICDGELPARQAAKRIHYEVVALTFHYVHEDGPFFFPSLARMVRPVAE